MSSQNNPWFAATIGLLGLIVGYSFANMSMTGIPAAPGNGGTVVNDPTPSVPTPSKNDPAGVDDDPMLGDEDATVTLIEFTDYQCPFCSRHYTQTYGQIKSQYVDTGKIKLVVRDYPLSFHPHAQKASEATECADDQGKFWDMHDKLFESQGAWSNLGDAVTVFKQYAADMGMNTSEFNDCLDNGTHAQEVQQDMSDGAAAGISGTPGFWVIGPDGEGELISGAYPFSEFQRAIDERL